MAGPYFEDYRTGEVVRAPGVTVTEAEIVHFALQYDPQPIHLDRHAAAGSLYGGLIASGFQILALGFRMLLQAGFIGTGSAGSPGLDEVRWLRPVRPGDTIRAEAEVIETRPSSSKPDRGVVRVAYRIVNQDGEVVTTFRAAQLILRRPT